MKKLLLALTLILAAIPLASAATTPSCPYTDCPLWAQGSYAQHSDQYAPPTSTYRSYAQQRSDYWYDDRAQTRYRFYDIHHPPRVWYVHRNDNYYRTNGGTSSSYRRYHHASGYNRDGTVFRGSHFNVHY